jgi:RNA polymerase sigma-70 factor (ECF subfamily)
MMGDEESIAGLIRRIRGGDEAAAAELVRRYEPAIRRRVRVWLRMQDPRLRRVVESMDITQSVLASFFARASHGQFELENPDQLVGLLVRMTRHKLIHQVEKHQARRRDIRRDQAADPQDPSLEPASPGPSPSRCVAGRELLREFRARLNEEERLLADRRAEGRVWDEIAAELGGTAEGRRKQLARALDRVSRQLGLDEGDLGD